MYKLAPKNLCEEISSHLYKKFRTQTDEAEPGDLADLNTFKKSKKIRELCVALKDLLEPVYFNGQTGSREWI